jgi:hypothetical protein
MTILEWPDEQARAPGAPLTRFAQPLSNLCLDLHGDPLAAKLVVFSDGNHHMALHEALRDFLAANTRIGDIFYATTPPRVVGEALANGGFALGNLLIAVKPHVFISPPKVLDDLVARGAMTSHQPLAASRGNVLLVRKHNPRAIHGITDLARADVKVFLSNPVTEAVSYNTYRLTLQRMAQRLGLALDILDGRPHPRVIYGESIHHREAPQAVADGRADAAVVFHHLALRYTRIFPDLFEMAQLMPQGENDPAQELSRVHIGVVGDGGTHGARLTEFMLGSQVAGIYQHHGLTPLG